MRRAKSCGLMLAIALITGTSADAAEDGGWWLNVFFKVGNRWVPGSAADGWEPRRYESEALCLERKAKAERNCELNPLEYPAAWYCTPGRPLDGLPDDLIGVPC